MEYESFRIGDLFEPLKVGYIGRGRKIGSAMKEPSEAYCIPLTCAKSGSNGVMYWGKKGDFITYVNAISIIADGAVSAGLVYAQPGETGAYSHSYFIRLKEQEVSYQTNLYLVCVLTKVIYPKYSRERAPRWENKVENDVITLPVISPGKPNYAYMEQYISELERERISELERYLRVTGLDDYELTEEEQQILQLRINYGEFQARDFFETEIKITNKRSKMDITKSGTIPLMSSESTNNGIIGYVQIEPEFIVSKETPFYLVFGDHTKAMNIMTTSFCVADNVKVLRPYAALSERSTQYIATAWKKAIPDKGYARHWAEAKNVYFKIPVTCDGKPDYIYMEKYIRVQEKLAVQNMIAMKDRVVQETRKIVCSAEK